MEELQAELEQIFVAHDVDQNGILDQVEFSKCIAELGANLNVDRRVCVEIFRAVDVNGDGVVEWHEFVQPAVRIIHNSLSQAINAEMEAEVAEAELEFRRAQATEIVLSGSTQ